MVIEQPIIHDRHIVKEQFQKLKANGELKFKKPDNLTIATCRNSGTLEDRIIPHLSGYEQTSILEENMKYLGLDLVVLRDDRLPWRNTFKFEMLHNYLKSGECTTEYFMCLDAIDVIWRDKPQRVIDMFESFDCDALFMSTNSTDGYNCMPEVKEWVDTINKKNRYLNPSLDRIDNNKGYIIGNVRLLSFKANAIKGDTLNPEIFKNMYNYMSETAGSNG